MPTASRLRASTLELQDLILVDRDEVGFLRRAQRRASSGAREPALPRRIEVPGD